MKQYLEPEKDSARKLALTAAIKCLTTERKNSTLTRKSYVREIRDIILNSDTGYDSIEASKLSDEVIERWEGFYDSIIQEKDASNLKVAYLSGPNPENDLHILCGSGILPENIWAFESENSVYSEAIISALNSKFPFIKIINGGIDGFIEASPQKFDIIYLDFCGPLPNRDKQKTLPTVTKILAKHALNSPGVLITNVSLPSKKQDPVGHNLLAKLVAIYLYPKQFLETNELDNDFTDGPTMEGDEFDDWLENVELNLDDYYGQFVTRLLMDIASFISPYDRFPRNNFLFSKFFKLKDNKEKLKANIQSIFHFDNNGNGGDIIIDPGLWSIPWVLATLDKKTNNKAKYYPQYIFNDDKFSKFAEQFISQLSVKRNQKELIDNIFSMSYLMQGGLEQEEFLSESMINISRNHNFGDYHLFCDVVLFHQIFELLFRQVAVPYHVNIEKTQRWKYKAKSTPMYLDMMVLDECRYLYDWMPTADMLREGMNNIERQLTYRFALDGIAKHGRWYNNEFFSGTAVMDQFTEPFEAKILSQRELIKNTKN